MFVLHFQQMGKENFIIAAGGPDAPVGTNGATVGQLAEVLEQLINHLTTPGARVYDADWNKDQFWYKLQQVVS